MSEDEFGELTPRMFHLLLDQREKLDRETRELFGLLAAVTVNASGNPPDPPAKPQDFFTNSMKGERRRNPSMGDTVRTISFLNRLAARKT